MDSVSSPFQKLQFVELNISRFCSEARLDPDASLQNLSSADVKAWFDWIKVNFRGSIKAHSALSTYWRTLKRLYFMKNLKTMGKLMEEDCINVSGSFPQA